MSKIHFEPVLAVKDNTDGLRVKFNPHPEDNSARVLYHSVERFIEHVKPAVGAVFAYITPHGFYSSWHDRTLPYGTVVLKRGFDWLFGDYIIITENGWEWAHDGSLEIHLNKIRLEEERQAEIAAFELAVKTCPALTKFPESVRRFFYHEGLA